MGVTLESKNCSLDFGYGGFNNIRTKVAELAADDIGEHYKHLSDAPFFEEQRKPFFEEYDKKITEISKAHNGEMDGILHFIYASDCDGEMPYEVCEQIYEVIKDYDDSILYGYCGRSDCAMFKDFKELVKVCVENNRSMTWF